MNTLAIKECKTCERPTRPRNVSADDAPGTIIRYTADQCGACYMIGKKRVRAPRGQRLSKPVYKHLLPGAPTVSATCIRCGFVRKDAGGTTSPLCRDCSEVLNRDEKALWLT